MNELSSLVGHLHPARIQHAHSSLVEEIHNFDEKTKLTEIGEVSKSM